jgi:uncharacterized Ntn-hydrolase superfamily protein
MTFSIAAVCQRTGELGLAVTTSSVCVGARVGRIGPNCVVFSQARTDPRLHADALEAFAASNDAMAALEAMKAAATGLHWRQLGVLARTGEGVHFTGESCLPCCGGMAVNGLLALGNFLGSEEVLPSIIEGASREADPLAERLINALEAGLAAGGEMDPIQSAAVMILGADGLYNADLRVDKSAEPLSDLASLWQDWQPKAAAYRIRALSPDDALPSSEVEHGGASA